MVQKRNALGYSLRSLVPPQPDGLNRLPPAYCWEQIYDSPAGIFNVATSKSDAWRMGRVPKWYAKFLAEQQPPPPLELTPEMKAQVDGILGQLCALLYRSRSRMIETFQDFDVDNSGRIDRKEFRSFVSALGVVAHKSGVDALFDIIDTDRGGTIDCALLSDILPYCV